MQAMRPPQRLKRARRLARGEVGVDRIKVVLADEDHWQFMERGEVGGFVERPLLDRRVPKKGHGDRSAVRLFHRKRSAHCDRDAARNDRQAQKHAHVGIQQVHRPTPAATTTCGFSMEFSEHAFEVAALRKVVHVRSMRGHDLIIDVQR